MVHNISRFGRRSQMPDEQRVANNSQTYVADADTFQFETMQHENGQATVIRFRLEDPQYHAGDVLVELKRCSRLSAPTSIRTPTLKQVARTSIIV